jgi:hypothetical protein
VSAGREPADYSFTTTDSQTGSLSFEDDVFNRARSLSQPTAFRRRDISLNLNSLPIPFENFQISPADLGPPSQPYLDHLQPQPYGYRVPASQPSSPVRTWASTQAPYESLPGRPRGATFSGGYQDHQYAFTPPIYLSPQVSVPVTDSYFSNEMEDALTPTPSAPPVLDRRTSQSSNTQATKDKVALLDR